MNSLSKNILLSGLCLGIIGILQFLAITVHLPFIATAAIAIVSCIVFIKWFNNVRNTEEEKAPKSFTHILFAACVLIFTNKAYYISTKYGLWDAWYIWDFHARYFIDSNNWQNMLANQDGAHPDYPIALPGLLAFAQQLFFFAKGWVANYAVHFLITLLIPVIVFTETYKKSIFVAGITLILFVTNEFYISQGLSQLADTLLALFFLFALISINNVAKDKRMIAVSAAFLGLCMLTKNEGLIMAAIFILFHARTFFLKGNYKSFAIGIALPLITWLLFKGIYAPANDMVSGQSNSTTDLVFDTERYKLIYSSFVSNFKEHFRDIRYGITFYLLILAIRGKWPDLQILMVFVICVIYMLIYVVSPYDLEWHLFTSQSRLMHQLMPAMMYLLANKFSNGLTTNFQLTSFSIPKRPR